MRDILPILAILAAGAAFADTRAVRQGPDVDHLYERVSESAFVVTGRVLEAAPVLRRECVPNKQVGPNRWLLDPRNLEGGRLFTVEVEGTICRQSDFGVAPLESGPPPSVVRVFVVPSREPQSARSKFDSFAPRWSRRFQCSARR